MIFSPLERGDGFRHGALGAPGYGKSHHIRHLIEEALEQKKCELAITHDVKGARPDFDGVFVRQVADVGPHIEEIERRKHVVFRGDAVNDIKCTAESVGAYAKQIARSGTPVLLNVNELDTCLTEGGRSWEALSVRWMSDEARSLKGSFVWTTRQPKRTPDEIFDQSTSISYFHLDRRAANYLGNTLLLDEDMVAILPKLAIGEYVIVQPGLEWNRKVYRDPP